MQVDRSHYTFASYMEKPRWISVWHQLDEVQRFGPATVLEIGVGSGLFKVAASLFGLDVKTLDIAADLNPDYLGSADAIPLSDGSIDVVCAFQVLEHMPFELSLAALAEMRRVARKAVVISLPDAKGVWVSCVKLPLLKTRRWMIPNPLARAKVHVFDGEHYWEVNKRDYPLDRVLSSMRKIMPDASVSTYRVHENPYHRFFVFTL